MVSWDQHRVDAHQAKFTPAHRQPDDVQGVKMEGELHNKILQECANRLWFPVHSRMDRKTTTKKGICDFIIFADKGRKFYFECKSATGKLSESQQIFIAWMKRLGHVVHVITSFQEFIRIVDEKTPSR